MNLNMKSVIAVVITWISCFTQNALSLRMSFSSNFAGSKLIHHDCGNSKQDQTTLLVMRKQKASDKRTSRLQRGLIDEISSLGASTLTSMPMYPAEPLVGVTKSPMANAIWNHKSVSNRNAFPDSRPTQQVSTGGRGRARKRAEVYSSLANYHSEFLAMLTAEYRAEEAEVLGRIEDSIDNPLSLEESGHALFDLYPERRGNIFSDEVYRFTKARDSVSHYNGATDSRLEASDGTTPLPVNHKFSTNDVILITLQPGGSGDFFGTASLPNHKDATSVEARVLNTGPTYIDVAMLGGAFESAFGPAPNNSSPSGRGDPRIRLRADRFFSNVPYLRMVSALGKLTSLPDRPVASTKPRIGEEDKANPKEREANHGPKIQLDPVIRDAIISTYGLSDDDIWRQSNNCDVHDIAKRISSAPFPKSVFLANQVLGFIQSNPGNLFRTFNGPQLKAIGAALTRKMTMIHGPPGTGKTSVAGAIAFGFVHQCRNLSPEMKVLACAFSNVGADNLAEEIKSLGLKVIRVGKASGVSEALWDITLDAAIDRDPEARKALQDAATATANLRMAQQHKSSAGRGNSASANNYKRDTATTAVKAAIEACRVAATRALREADVIVSTSIGAADARLLAACGIKTEEELEEAISLGSPASKKTEALRNVLAPDGLPALTLPFTIVDEACQSVEPGNLIPITASDSCRALVLLGDPCQLPPTVKTDTSGTGSSPLSQSLMTRLAYALPQPVIMSGQSDSTIKDETFLNAKPTRQAVSLVNYMSKITAAENNQIEVSSSYRKKFSGSLLLSLQYRMHPSISAFPSAVFYDGMLSTPSFLSSMRTFPRGLAKMFPCEDGSLGVRFVDVGGRSNERRGQSEARALTESRALSNSGEGVSSYSNEAEAKEIIEMLKTLFRQSTAATVPNSIGIVTPYSAQVALILSKLAADKELAELRRFLPNTSIEVKSVDAYQGRERDIIIVSCVRSNRNGRIGFLTDWRRMNVALTRAKTGLIIVGDRSTLNACGDKHWGALVKWCDGVGCVFPSSVKPQD